MSESDSDERIVKSAMVKIPKKDGPILEAVSEEIKRHSKKRGGARVARYMGCSGGR